jgi:tetratricopeptide (TPR) repeat protein
MDKRGRFLIIIAVIGLAVGLIGWTLLPGLIGALPGRVKEQLPGRVLALALTPLPTALPAPERVEGVATAVILIPTLPPPSPTATATTTHPPATGNPPPATTTRPPPATPTPTATSHQLPATSHLPGLTIVPQKFNNCGPTNLSLVLNYYGVADDQFDVAAIIRPTYEDRNVSPEEMAYYVNENTPLRAALHRGGDLELLQRLLAAGYPVIIETGLLLSEREGWMGHYLTLIGYDAAEEQFISLDTFRGPWDGSGRADSFAWVAEYWSHFNNVFLVVYPAADEAEVANLIGPERRNPLTMWRQAAEQAEQAAQREPENGFAWFNLGSSLTRLGNLTGESDYYASAAEAFDRARLAGLPWRMVWYQFEMYEAYLGNGRYEDILTLTAAAIQSGGNFVEETHLYRGHALAALGELPAARTAYNQAINLNPASAVGRAAQASLSGLTTPQTATPLIP